MPSSIMSSTPKVTGRDLIGRTRHLVWEWADLINGRRQSPCDRRLADWRNGGRRLQELLERPGGLKARRDSLLT